MIAYPFEMDTIVRLSGDRLVATHYGLYNTICGIGITLGNLLTGASLDAARAAGMSALPWVALFASAWPAPPPSTGCTARAAWRHRCARRSQSPRTHNTTSPGGGGGRVRFRPLRPSPGLWRTPG